MASMRLATDVPILSGQVPRANAFRRMKFVAGQRKVVRPNLSWLAQTPLFGVCDVPQDTLKTGFSTQDTATDRFDLAGRSKGSRFEASQTQHGGICCTPLLSAPSKVLS